MSFRRSFIRFVHKCDVYNKTTTTNDTGQKRPLWVPVATNVDCAMTPSGASPEIRSQPTQEEADFLTVQFPHDAPIDYTVRVYNLRTKTGELIYAGPFMVNKVDKPVSFTGKVQFIDAILKLVTEGAE
jgi:hypothetical protein